MALKNADIREFITKSKLKRYQVAELLGMTRNDFGVSLRYEYTEEEKERIKQLIRDNAERILNSPPKNADIREAIQNAGLKYYEVADLLHIRDVTFSNWLAQDLPEKKKAHILQVIKENSVPESA